MAFGTSVLSIHAAVTYGDGLLADGVVYRDMQCRSLAVTTAVVASAPGQIDALEPVSLGLLAQQFETIFAAGRPDAARVGILIDPEQMELTAELLQTFRAGVPDRPDPDPVRSGHERPDPLPVSRRPRGGGSRR
jgi:hydroxymethylpyrimidine/phosphomethylpyrimidine kinase